MPGEAIAAASDKSNRTTRSGARCADGAAEAAGRVDRVAGAQNAQRNPENQ